MSCCVVAATLLSALPAGAWSAAPARSEQWDPRVKPFVRFVEKERGHEFERPVRVEFLDADAFAAAYSDGGAPTPDDLEWAAGVAAELAALGLTKGRAAPDALLADDPSAIAGFYDPEQEALFVHATSLEGIDARVTVVHELTHALQDQQFDLDALDAAAATDAEYDALQYLVEGDATVVEEAYVDSRPRTEQDQYWGEQYTPPTEGSPAELPYVFSVLWDAPYRLGAAYVYALDRQGGTRARDRAFARPPTTDEVVIDPIAMARDERPAEVPAPEVPVDAERIGDPGELGAVMLYLALGARLDSRTTLDAVTGWGGGRYVVYDRSGAACVRGALVGDRGRDSDELAAALLAWRAEMPEGAVQVAREGDATTFTSCEVGGIDEPTVRRFDRAIYNVLGGRVWTVLDLKADGVESLEDAECVGDAVSTDPKAVEVYDDSIAEYRDLTRRESAVVDRAYDRSFELCEVDDPLA